MNAVYLPVHRELAASSRLAIWTGSDSRPQVAELAILAAAGASSALAVGCLNLHVRIPGHAIVQAVLPMALGLSLVPRRLGGIIMGASAYGTIALLQLIISTFELELDVIPGKGAMTSLMLIGPMLEVALWRIRAGWPVYLGFACSGAAANAVAFAVRGAGKMSGREGVTGRPLADWLTIAPWTYILCGLIAGLLSAAIWFRARADRSPDLQEGTPS